MQAEINFRAFVDAAVAERLRGPLDWATLLYSLPGIYPAAILDSVRRLGMCKLVSHPGSFRADGGHLGYAGRLWSQGMLPTPHALDAAWWFADSALEELWDAIRRFSSPGNRALLLGTPTLFHFARERATSHHVFLMERSGPVSPHLGRRCAMKVDLLTSQPRLASPASVVIVDAPWYSGEMCAFLLTARRNATNGTRIFLSTPPVGTRPGVQHEWDELIAWAERIGLRLVDYKYGLLPYISPPFEQNALRAAGVPDCPLDWRRADLAVFSCVEKSPCQLNAPAFADHTWQEARIGQVMVRIRSAVSRRWEDPGLRELISGDVLPSVSRRDQRLESVNVWTSGNRVFGCRGVSILRWITKALETHQCPADEVRKKLGHNLGLTQIAEIERTTTRLKEIIDIEEQELADWGQKAYGELVHRTT